MPTKTVTIEVTDTELFVHCDDGIRTLRRTTYHPPKVRTPNQFRDAVTA
jgi:hypothetical protein